MKLILESNKIQDYLGEIFPYIRYNNPIIREKIKQIESQAPTLKERAKIAFEMARDEIHHSFDTKNKAFPVTISAEEVLEKKEGICFSKAHLLATLLRGMNIPTGFCYQRVLRNPNDPNSGHALHGLNAVYLEEIGWFRLDPRGNKPGINSQFSTEQEKLAYPIREEYDEIDYPYVYTKPLDAVITSMENSENSLELFNQRPEKIIGFL